MKIFVSFETNDEGYPQALPWVGLKDGGWWQAGITKEGRDKSRDPHVALRPPRDGGKTIVSQDWLTYRTASPSRCLSGKTTLVHELFRVRPQFSPSWQSAASQAVGYASSLLKLSRSLCIIPYEPLRR
jgi:hypothetical protein